MDPDLESLLGQPALLGLDEAQVEAFFKIAQGVNVEAGQRVVAAGEAADSFFLVRQGTLEVMVESSGKPVVVARIEAGQTVGEMSLIYRQKVRQADVVAATPCALWRFDFADIEALEKSLPSFARRFNANLARIIATRGGASSAGASADRSVDQALARRFTRSDRDLLRRTAVFSGVTGEELDVVKDLIEPVLIARGEPIARQGQEADCFYVVAEGLVEVQIEKAGRAFPVARTGPGQVLGELALIYRQQTRSSTLIAVTLCRLLEMSFEGFNELTRKEPAIGKKLHLNLARIAAARALSLSEDSPFQRKKERSS